MAAKVTGSAKNRTHSIVPLALLVPFFMMGDLKWRLDPHAIISKHNFPSSIMFLFRRKPAPPPDAVRLDILLYHFVSDECNDFTLSGHTVATAEFRKQMEYLAGRCTMVRLGKAAGLASGAAGKGPFAAVCFDDGYRCVWEEAYPILREIGIPAMMFVNPPVLGNRDLLWRDKIRYLMRMGLEEEFVSFLRSRRGRYHFGSLGKLGFYKWSKNPKALGNMAIQQDVDAFFSGKGFDAAEIASRNRLFMEEKDVATREFLEFGNHTWSHPILTLLSAAEQKTEIGKCHEYLAARGPAPTGLALPFSPFNRKTVSLCRDFGYAYLLTVYEESNHLAPGKRDLPLILHRWMAPRDAGGMTSIV
jgi:peptidoglycan/xylan/chitin deacetylase (PgdA/CDA1 family)